MESTVSYELKCKSCGALCSLQEEQLNHVHCPECGKSEKLLLIVSVNDFVKVAEDLVSVIGKKPSLPSKKKRRVEYSSGKSLTADTGEYNHREVFIDRLNDYYEEKVVNLKTGDVIHHTKAKLSEHIGHGTAKFKNNT